MRTHYMIKRVFIITMTLLLSCAFWTICNAKDISAQDHPVRLVDDAGLLNSEESADVQDKLDEISEKWQFDIVIVTVNSLNGKSAMEYADDYFDYNGYGYGDNKDGVLLLVAMNDREWHISTSGFGITAFTDAGIDYMSTEIKSSLTSGDYAKAFDRYVGLCNKYLNKAQNGKPYDEGNLPLEVFNGIRLLIAICIGLAAACVPAMYKKSLLKSVRGQAMADTYMTDAGLKLNFKRDQFINRTVTSRVIAKDKNGGPGGGSSTHTGSSGGGHGGRGGSF